MKSYTSPLVSNSMRKYIILIFSSIESMTYYQKYLEAELFKKYIKYVVAHKNAQDYSIRTFLIPFQQKSYITE